MRKIQSIIMLSTVIFFTACSGEVKTNTISSSTDSAETETDNKAAIENKDLSGYATAYFASGCFWCVEAIFESVDGVEEAVSGYAGGEEQNPTYEQVGGGETGHTESVKVYYDPNVVSYETLVKVFYGSHDPTTKNGQHPDYGKQYRSAIFYQTEEEKQIVDNYIAKLEASKEYHRPIATEVSPYKKFWEAEAYHQNYERLHPNQGYVKSVSIPRLRKFQAKFPELLKKETAAH